MGEFEKAEVEIRIFEKDFGRDSPLARYKVQLLTARATNTVGIMEEDRIGDPEISKMISRYEARLLS